MEEAADKVKKEAVSKGIITLSAAFAAELMQAAERSATASGEVGWVQHGARSHAQTTPLVFDGADPKFRDFLLTFFRKYDTNHDGAVLCGVRH